MVNTEINVTVEGVELQPCIVKSCNCACLFVKQDEMLQHAGGYKHVIYVIC